MVGQLLRHRVQVEGKQNHNRISLDTNLDIVSK